METTLFSRSHMTYYYHSIVTMSSSYITSEILQDTGSKQQIFHTPSVYVTSSKVTSSEF